MKRLLIGGLAALAIALTGAPAANAEPAGYSTQDGTFYRLLTTPDDDGLVITVTNPALIRAQGLMVCQRIDNGMDGLDAIYQLMAEGPYSFDAANSISAAAQVAYCRDNLGR